MGKHKALFGFILGAGTAIAGMSIIKNTRAAELAKLKYQRLANEIKDYADVNISTEAHHMPPSAVEKMGDFVKKYEEISKKFDEAISKISEEASELINKQCQDELERLILEKGGTVQQSTYIYNAPKDEGDKEPEASEEPEEPEETEASEEPEDNSSDGDVVSDNKED